MNVLGFHFDFVDMDNEIISAPKKFATLKPLEDRHFFYTLMAKSYHYYQCDQMALACFWLKAAVLEFFEARVGHLSVEQEKIFRVRVGMYRIQYVVLRDRRLLFITAIEKRARAY